MLLPLQLLNLLDEADVTAPVLSDPTATGGAEELTGTVTTDEGNGTLYFYASANSSETAATIKASGESQSVTATGVQNVTVSNPTPGTYYIHYVHDDASSNESNVVSSTAVEVTTAEATVKGGYVPPKYIKGKLRKKDESIRDEIEELLSEVKQAPVVLPQKIEDQVRDVYEEAPRIINLKASRERTRQLNALRAEISDLRNTVHQAVKAAQDDEEAAIQAIISML